MTIHVQTIESPVGPLVLAAEGECVRAVTFPHVWRRLKKNFSVIAEQETSVIRETKNQLQQYFQGKRRTFDLPLALTGTDFQNRAWSALKKIPFGTTATYKQQAVAANAPKAVRAIGRTNGLNPLCIVLPCHRVIGSNGSLTGYAGGLRAKQILLELEKAAA